MLLQVVSKSFAVVAMLLIASIAALVVASDIHTYVTRRKPQKQRSLLLGSDEIAIEMDHFSPSEMKRRKKCLPNHASMRYAQLFQSQSVNYIPTHYNPASLSFAWAVLLVGILRIISVWLRKKNNSYTPSTGSQLC